MKKLFLSILLSTATSVAFGQGQGELTTTTTTTTRPATSGQLETQLPNGRPGAAPYIPKEGSVQLAIRTGKPLQLLNPMAPARYGTGEEHTSHEPKDPGKPKGMVFFAWTF
jgi:hypothetical protein